VVVGREAERTAIERFAAEMGGRARALVIEGEAGIGKTTLWQVGVQALRARGMIVLEARPAESETALPFAALADLLEPLDEGSLGALPEPQRRALDAALQRESADEPSSKLALARATLALVRGQAVASGVAIAIDDAQWLDSPTAQVLAFVLRREASQRVLVSRRLEDSEPLPLGLDDARRLHVERLRVGPLGPSELGRLVEAELGVHLSRAILLGLHRTSGGNPFYAIEIVRSALDDSGAIDGAAVLLVPASLGTLLRARLALLSARVREVALLCSATSHPTTSVIGRATRSAEGLREALGASVLRIEGEHLRFDHPLLASVVYESATPAERREAHRRLAEVLDRDERAIQLALATELPDEEVAVELAAAAQRAQLIAARTAAAELGEQALRLTPPDSPLLARRIVAAADHWLAAGDTARSRELLERAMALPNQGPDRAAILFSLGLVCYRAENLRAASEILGQAAHEAASNLPLRVEIEHARAFVATGLGDVAGGIELARNTLRLAERLADPGLLALALTRVAAAEFVGGLGLDRDRFERAVALEKHVGDTLVEWLPSYQYSCAAGFADDHETARGLYEGFLRPIVERDGELAVPLLIFQSQFECRAGNWSAADSIAKEAIELSLLDVPAVARAFALGSRALIDAHLGRIDEARACAEQALRVARESQAAPPLQLLLWALGFLELSLGDPAAAHAHLGPLAQMTVAVGAEEPGVFRFLPDEIEALIELGQHGEARAVLEVLDERARAVERVSMIAAACRCRALLNASLGDLTRAGSALEEALEHHARLSQPFELARTLLTAGKIERRAHRRAKAREALGRALEVFDALGAPLWAEKAAAELERVPGKRRRPEPGLTATERRVAELVASGHTNKEVAAALFISVRTVEANLTRVYEKLGLRSRTELSRRLAEDAGTQR
jgi:DNA-binding CsgD family transcriptional regulator